MPAPVLPAQKTRVQVVANIFGDMPVYPALNTMFCGTNDGAGQWSENGSTGSPS